MRLSVEPIDTKANGYYLQKIFSQGKRAISVLGKGRAFRKVGSGKRGLILKGVRYGWKIKFANLCLGEERCRC